MAINKNDFQESMLCGRLDKCDSDKHCLYLELSFSDMGLIVSCKDCGGWWVWSKEELAVDHGIKIEKMPQQKILEFNNVNSHTE